MLSLKNINAGYDKKKVLTDVSVEFKSKSITVIMGPNGAGKSTLLKVAFGLLKPYQGEVFFENNSVKASPQLFVQKGIFMVPQGKRVFQNMTVKENIELATHFWKSRSHFEDELEKILADFAELKPFLKMPAGNLSGGQQQMVALARAFINNPKMVLMDEPAIGLSPKLINETFHKLKDNPNFNMTTIALTANAISEMKEKYLSEGFDGYLSKPVAKDDLDKLLREFFNTGTLVTNFNKKRIKLKYKNKVLKTKNKIYLHLFYIIITVYLLLNIVL